MSSLSDKIQTILSARSKIKTKIEENKVQNEFAKEEISKLQEPLIQEMKVQQQLLQQLPQPSYEPPKLPQLTAPPRKKRKVLDMNPDKGIEDEIMKHFDLTYPSDFIDLYNEPDRSSQIEATLKKVNSLLKSYGGKKSTSKNDAIENIIKSLRHYKESIKVLQKIPHFQVPEQTGSGNKDPCERLQLLVASRLAGNDNRKIVDEAKSILNQLIKDKMISRSDYVLILHNFLK